jgi:hypothetical protein
MGCDIHMMVEVAEDIPLRGDREMRRVERAAALGDSEAAERLASYWKRVWKPLPIYDDFYSQEWENLSEAARAKLEPRLHTDNWLHDIGYRVVLHDPDIRPYTENRNYGVFGLLAGVRRYDVEPIAAGRGIPDDASDEVRKWMADGDHSHSWALVGEILEHRDEFLERHEPELVAMCEDLAAKYGPDKARLCFWFDS